MKVCTRCGQEYKTSVGETSKMELKECTMCIHEYWTARNETIGPLANPFKWSNLSPVFDAQDAFTEARLGKGWKERAKKKLEEVARGQDGAGQRLPH